jgi:hypothetical protein
MKLPLDFHPEAVEEVDAAYAWYEQNRAGLAEGFFSAFLEQLDRIQENPEG